ncbi:MAG: hypothetical protein WCP01_10760 [Methylococcaceae bacterium]|jgi:O-Antigen ligase
MNEQYQKLSSIKIFFISAIVLLTGHLLLQQYMPNMAVGGLAFLFLILIFSYFLIYKKDPFSFVIIIYICSHFSYGDNHGGLWNILSFVILVFYFLFVRNKNEFNQKDTASAILLTIFIFFDVIGLALNNPMTLEPTLKGASAFFGYILMYIVASRLKITPERVRLFLYVSLIMLIYQFLVALIQYYSLVNWGTPLLGGNTLEMIKVTSANRPIGTIQNFELFAEYALLMVCISMPFLSSKTTKEEVGFNYIYLSLMIFICISIMIITSMRGATVLVVLVTVFYYIIFPLRIIAAINAVGQQSKIIILVALLLPAVSVYIGMKELSADFKNVNTKIMNIENIVSGKSINRGGLSDMAAQRISNESWIFGYGFSVPESNRWAWWGFDTTKRNAPATDYHSLYLELPMIYGWLGSFSFISLILVTMHRLVMVTIKYRNKQSYLIILSLGLFVMWGMFLIHEYKIGMLRNSNYQMLFWIWLGLSSSVVKTIKEKWQVNHTEDYRLNTLTKNHE